MPRVYDDRFEYTQEGLGALRDIEQALRPTLDALVRAGYSPRDVAHLAVGAAVEYASAEVLIRRVDRMKARRIARSQEPDRA